MAIKKFILSTGDGDSEESELDSYGNRTIGYDDILQKIIISNAHILGTLTVSGSITGSLSGSASGGGMSTVYTVGNITGSGKENDEVRLKDNIELSSVTASFTGDGSRLYNLSNESIFDYSEASEALSLHDIVSIGINGVSKCNKSDEKLSSIFGIVTKISGTSYYISTSGRMTASLNSSYDRGTIVYAHSNGSACQYSDLTSGDYVTQVGFVWTGSIGVGNKGVVILQPRIFGQLA